MARLRGEIERVEARLARPLGARADKREGLARGYGSRGEWHAKSRRLQAMRDRTAVVEANWAAGRVRMVRDGKHLARARHHLAAAGMDETAWRQRWQAERMFLAADEESGKRFGKDPALSAFDLDFFDGLRRWRPDGASGSRVYRRFEVYRRFARLGLFSTSPSALPVR
ncbi:hypothetical protein [Streptomyces sp. NL15-2K]|uniref:hypothetical protein n=1 Tax=Streptomyces sp. NL15-2K TaxID=376149 RepID=UPI000FF9149C|nr:MULTISPECIES: hypothetical protein [Actinomycetes]WKX10019.1 hypothetical protein Q4V64_21995 [Kutzneria buriramensis]GCB48435.1 hypothetical protein SNL152K_5759 [Streptomyces sp. NL15-2K]